MAEMPRIAGRVLLAATAFLVPTILIYRTVVDVSSPYPGAAAAEPAPAPAETVFVGVISRYPSSVIYRGYQPVMDYLSQTTGRYFALRLSGTYEETVQQLVRGRVAAAFLGAYLYVKAHDEHGVVSIVQPVNDDGKPRFRSVLLVREGSDLHRPRDLRGRRLALPPELSYSANWLLTRVMPAVGVDSTALRSLRFLPNHHAAVYELLRGNADAAAVKDRVAQEYRGRGVRVIATSDPIPGAPIVVAARHDTALVGAITRALLSLDRRAPGFREITAKWDPEFANGFTRASDADYDVLRQMLAPRRR
ncbi:MAG: PhnD/SsuA/transferrin family substrate-binding protein [Gemmatimonadetes bacterium]|nr:PhnD/SsuA/transferrin family substrate-binding protein [Gemmatimonadota bacterium]